MLQKIMVRILDIPHFKLTLTSLYMIDLLSHPTNAEIRERAGGAR